LPGNAKTRDARSKTRSNNARKRHGAAAVSKTFMLTRVRSRRKTTAQPLFHYHYFFDYAITRLRAHADAMRNASLRR